MALQRLTGAENNIEALSSVSMRGLEDTGIRLVTDTQLALGSAVLCLQPPEAFDATLVNGRLTVTHMEGKTGGAIEVRVNPPADSDVNYSLHSRGGDVTAQGAEDSPLHMGSLSLYTTGEGKVFARGIRAARMVRFRHAADESKIATEDVSAPLVITRQEVVV